MYVGGGRRGYPGEVRLVRVRPCDSRAGRHMKRRRTRRGFKAAALGLAAASLLGACLCGIYLLVDSRPQGEVVELMAEKLPEEVPGSPLDVGSVNIVQALEKPEPEPQPEPTPKPKRQRKPRKKAVEEPEAPEPASNRMTAQVLVPMTAEQREHADLLAQVMKITRAEVMRQALDEYWESHKAELQAAVAAYEQLIRKLMK